MHDPLFLYEGETHPFVRDNMLHLGYDPHHFGRYPTMKIALNYYMQTGGRYIVETGCQRDDDLAGSGGSTVLFSRFIETYGGAFSSVDIDPNSIAFARRLLGENTNIDFICEDSVSYLSRRTQKIDLLYLDSYDYPYGRLLEAYGGQQDLQKAIDSLRQVSEEEIVNRFEKTLLPSQQHCLNEVHAALKGLSRDAVILIDDAMIPGGGKARLARNWLLSNGWCLLLAGYQQVFIREKNHVSFI